MPLPRLSADASPQQTADEPRARETPPSLPIQAVHLVALSSFAIAQPLFDLLGRNATFFAAHQSSPGQIALWALVLLLAVPAALIGIEAIASLFSRRLESQLHTLFVSCLGALIVVPPIIRSMSLDSVAGSIVFVVVAAAVGSAYRLTAIFPRILTWAAVAPVVFVAWFAFATPANGLLFDSTQQSTAVSAGSSAPPVVLIVFDELALSGLVTPEGELNSDRYPGFGRLAATSTWYPNATTIHDQTRVAVTSLLTGSVPDENTIPIASEHPRNLFSMVGNSYDIEARESVTHICSVDDCGSSESSEVFGLGPLISDTAIVYGHLTLPGDIRDSWIPTIDNRWASFTDGPSQGEAEEDEEVATLGEIRDSTRARLQERREHSRWENFLADLGSREKPTLFYMHSLLPHTPWRYLPDGKQYENDFFGDMFTDPSGAVWRDDPVYTHQGIQRFLLQTQFVDRQVGLVLDALDDQGMLADSLVVVTADHGIAFRPGEPRRNLSEGAELEEILPVPLFIKYPGQRVAEVDTEPARIIDILPTIADVLDLDGLGWEFDGSSLLDRAEPATLSHGVLGADGLEEIAIAPLESASAVAEELSDVFGPGTERYDVYGIGENRDLIGIAAESAVGARTSPTPVAKVSGLARLEDVDASGPVVPARVVGTLSEQPTSEDLALGLNGIVSGVAKAYYYPDGEVWRFSFFVPTQLLANGCNEVSMYQIQPNGELVPIQLEEEVGC